MQVPELLSEFKLCGRGCVPQDAQACVHNIHFTLNRAVVHLRTFQLQVSFASHPHQTLAKSDSYLRCLEAGGRKVSLWICGYSM